MINSEDYHHITTHRRLINTTWCVIKAVVSADTKMGAIADSTIDSTAVITADTKMDGATAETANSWYD